MRLLLVLLALLSGLSLAEVTASTARAEVVGSASGAILAASHEPQASVSLAKVQRPACERRLVRTHALPVVALARTISIVICDRPLE